MCKYYNTVAIAGIFEGSNFQMSSLNKKFYDVIFEVSSVEHYYNTVIVIDYQLQIPLHFGSTTKTMQALIFLHKASSYNFCNITM